METPGRIAELERKFGENPRRYFAALANEYRKAGELERAIELCERHLAEQRNHLSGHVVLAQALVDAGRQQAAWEPLHTALDLDPENFIALRLLGELSARTGDTEQARGYFFRALEIEPRSEQILEALKDITVRRADAAAPAEQAVSLAEPTVAELAEAAAEPVAEPAAEPLAEPLAKPVAESEAEPAQPRDLTWDELREPVAEHAEQAAPPEQGEWVEPTSVALEPTDDFPWLVTEDEPSQVEEAAPQQNAAAPEFTDDLWSGWDVASADEQATSTAEEQPTFAAEEQPTFAAEEQPTSAAEEQPTSAADEQPTFTRGEIAEEVVAEQRDEDASAEWHREEPAAEERAESRPTLASETMVELYLSQGHVTFALEALRDLVASRPDDERLRTRLAELEQAAATPPRETVRDLFARLGRKRSRATEAATALADAFADRRSEPGPLALLFEGTEGEAAQEDKALVAVLDDEPSDVPDVAAFERWLEELRRR